MENARRMGEYISRPPRRLAETSSRIVGDVRGKGLMIGVEIVKDQKTKERAPELRDRIVNRAFAQGPADSGRGRKYVAPLLRRW